MTIAIFPRNQPVTQWPQFSYEWMKAEWLFSSTGDRDEFAASPKRYAPQHGDMPTGARLQVKPPRLR